VRSTDTADTATPKRRSKRRVGRIRRFGSSDATPCRILTKSGSLDSQRKVALGRLSEKHGRASDGAARADVFGGVWMSECTDERTDCTARHTVT
jgi:hypothetical protein